MTLRTNRIDACPKCVQFYQRPEGRGHGNTSGVLPAHHHGRGQHIRVLALAFGILIVTLIVSLEVPTAPVPVPASGNAGERSHTHKSAVFEWTAVGSIQLPQRPRS